MAKNEMAGMQGQARWDAGGWWILLVAINRVPHDRMARRVKLYANLVFAAGKQSALQMTQGYPRGGGADEAVIENGGAATIGGARSDDSIGAFDEVAGKTTLGGARAAMDQYVILPGDGMVAELGFEMVEGLDPAGEDQQAGGVLIQAVDQINFIFAIGAGHVAMEKGQDRRPGFLRVGGGEQTGRLIHHHDIGILMDDF